MKNKYKNNEISVHIDNEHEWSEWENDTQTVDQDPCLFQMPLEMHGKIEVKKTVKKIFHVY